MNYAHIPVLLSETLEYLDPRPGQNIVDATLGGGGYTSAILEKVRPDGKVLAIDLDEDAIENFKVTSDKSQVTNLKLVQGNFAGIDKIIGNHKFPPPDGIVADLGLSSYELMHRGISFQTDQPLDMRFDLSQPLDAKFILNNYDEKRLTKIFEDYGEEKFARQIARKILENRNKKLEIKNTTDLYQIIVNALPKPVKHKADDSARRIFQALRIEVNHELNNLEEFLPKAFDVLAPGGRLVVVSFHSLEDRIVKQFFVGLTKGCVCPIDFPQCICGKNPKAKILTKKPVTASAEELTINPKAKPAKLRAIIKL
jgi:16S rRNA (cytosine1402-N4)-methyltransferase